MKVEKIFNKKEGREMYRTRFELNGKVFRPIGDTRKKLGEIVDEIRAREHRSRFELPVVKVYPTVKEIFDDHLQRLKKDGNRKKISFFERVSEKSLDVLPPDIKISELKKAHFQKYIDRRLTEKNKQSGAPILPGTINKERIAVVVPLADAHLYFPALEDLELPQMPKTEAKKRRRERLVKADGNLDVLLEYLRRPHKSLKTEAYRRNLADNLEIRYETGLRRKEVVKLKKSQYASSEAALKDVVSWKTGTLTKFFPLTARAVEIVESRLQSDSEYLFSKTGKPDESSYRALKKACEHLEIPYGAYTEGGWVPHDLRHNFATEIVRVADLATAKSLTGHTGQSIFTYLHTDEKRQREAMNRREGKEVSKVLSDIYNEVKSNKTDVEAFVTRVGSLIRNGQ